MTTEQYFTKIPPVNFPREFSRGEIDKRRAFLVNVWDIHTQQESIDLDYAMKSKNNKTPLAVRHNGMIILIDGHHRVVREIHNGLRQVKIKILEL